MLGDPSQEMDFVAATLDVDQKNYHTWAYRQWVLAFFGGMSDHQDLHLPGASQFPQLWDAELSYTDKMIRRDIRNNSAFNHRWFCIFGRALQSKDRLDPALEKQRDQEIAYALDILSMAPNNASPWNYLRGYVWLLLIGSLHQSLPPNRPLGDMDSHVAQFIRNMDHTHAIEHPEEDQAHQTSPYALEWLFDSCLERILCGDKKDMSTAEIVRFFDL